jgi:transcriptional regulator with XRE-family HTH domain
MAKPRALPYDRYVGDRIREARLALDMTQRKLAEDIGISYQQLQKYERGANRISGARLQLLSSALRQPLTYFFPNPTDVRSAGDSNLNFMLTRKSGQTIVKLYPRLVRKPRVERAVIELMEAIVEQADD